MENTLRKQRPDSSHSNLTEEQEKILYEACRTQGYRKAADLAKEKFGYTTSFASLSRWYKKKSVELNPGETVCCKNCERLQNIIESQSRAIETLGRKNIDQDYEFLKKTIEAQNQTIKELGLKEVHPDYEYFQKIIEAQNLVIDSISKKNDLGHRIYPPPN